MSESWRRALLLSGWPLFDLLANMRSMMLRQFQQCCCLMSDCKEPVVAMNGILRLSEELAKTPPPQDDPSG